MNLKELVKNYGKYGKHNRKIKKNKNEKIFVLLFKHDSKHLKMYILNKNTLNVSLKEYDYSILMFSTFFERNMFTLIFL